MLNYCMLPAFSLDVLTGNSYALHVLTVLCFNQNTRTRRTRFMSKSWIADITGISRTQVYREIQTLESLGLIEPFAERRGEWMWYLKCLEKLDASAQSDEELATELATLMQEVNQI